MLTGNRTQRGICGDEVAVQLQALAELDHVADGVEQHGDLDRASVGQSGPS
jgi:hypothetical protein